MSTLTRAVAEIIKEFKLTTWAVNNKTSVYVIIGILLIIGFKSYTSMPKESFPEVKQPIVYINTAYPGNSGSPVYHIESGEVVGVINKVFVSQGKESALSAPSGISYAIPVKHVDALLKKRNL